MDINSYNITRATGGGVTGNFSNKISAVYLSGNKFADIYSNFYENIKENNTSLSHLVFYVTDKETQKNLKLSKSATNTRSTRNILQCLHSALKHDLTTYEKRLRSLSFKTIESISAKDTTSKSQVLPIASGFFPLHKSFLTFACL